MLLRDYFKSEKRDVAFEFRKKIKNSPPCVHVLHKTLNLVIPRCCFAENGKEAYQNAKRTYRAIVFPHQTYYFAALSLPLWLLQYCKKKNTNLIPRWLEKGNPADNFNEFRNGLNLAKTLIPRLQMFMENMV